MTISRRAALAASVIALAVSSVAGCGGGSKNPPQVRGNGPSPAELMETLESGDFDRIAHPWKFDFPADHGPHNRYRNESWRITGTVEDAQRRRLGIQLVIARIGLRRPSAEALPSRWAATDVYAALFSISDPDSGPLHTYQRMSRDALGLAGAQAEPLRVWVENWRLEQRGGNSRAPDLDLHISAEGLKLDLDLRSDKPLVDAGNIAGPRSALRTPFVFYVQPRLTAAGKLSLGDRRTTVNGSVSLEHAWGELPLPGGPVASDRFTLHMDDGRDLFLLRTHRVDNWGEPDTTGLWVDREGRPSVLSKEELELDPVDYWRSGRTGAQYPVRWVLRLPGLDTALDLVPYSGNQEGLGWTAFWAGAVRLAAGSGPVGNGFVRLNGYDDS